MTGTVEYEARDVYRFAAGDGQWIKLLNEGNAAGSCKGLDDLARSLQHEESGLFLFRNAPMADCSSPGYLDGHPLAAGTYRLTIENDAAGTRSYAFTLIDAGPSAA